MITLFRVILPVPDIDRAATFYATVLGIKGQRVSAGRHYFACGGSILACYDPQAEGDDLAEGYLAEGWRHHPNEYLYFAVHDLEETRHRLELAGAGDITSIEIMPWGERLVYARDPFGRPIAAIDDQTLFTGGTGHE